MEAPGIDPGTSRMLSERSTIWATPPDVREGQLNSHFIFELNAFPLSLTEFTGFGQDRKETRRVDLSVQYVGLESSSLVQTPK